MHFSPSKNWDKLPGYQIDRTVTIGIQDFILGTGAAEALNLAAVAQQIGFTRDLVEAGVKDIVNGLTRVLKRGSIVNLTMGMLGKMVFQNQDIKFRFAANFMKLLNEEQKTKYDWTHGRKPISNEKAPAGSTKKENQEEVQKTPKEEQTNEKKPLNDNERGEKQVARTEDEAGNQYADFRKRARNSAIGIWIGWSSLEISKAWRADWPNIFYWSPHR